jgi:tellurite resistance protein TerA
MSNFTKGQRAKLADLTSETVLEMGVQLTFGTPCTVDISCFGVDANGQLSDDRYLIFYNQKQSPCGSLQALGSQGSDNERFRVDLGRLPQSIRRLVFTATIDGAGTMAQLRQGTLELRASGRTVASFGFTGADFGQEKAILVGELYFKDVWRFAAIGQGFEGGMSALLKHFGGQEIRPAAPPPPTARPAPPPPPEPPKVNLGKVSLKKQGESAVLRSTPSRPFTRMNVKLRWTAAVDLDLHAFYKMKNGQAGHVFFASRGDLRRPPHIQLDQDAGVGNTAGNNEENITITTLDNIEYVLIATNIFRLTSFLSPSDNFARYDGRVLVQTDLGDDIEVPLTSQEPGRWCIIAELDNTNVQAPRVVNINKVQKDAPALETRR